MGIDFHFGKEDWLIKDLREITIKEIKAIFNSNFVMATDSIVSLELGCNLVHNYDKKVNSGGIEGGSDKYIDLFLDKYDGTTAWRIFNGGLKYRASNRKNNAQFIPSLFSYSANAVKKFRVVFEASFIENQ